MRILVTWELGGGWGHVSRVAPLVRGLVQRGHELVLSVLDPGLAAPRVPGAEVRPLPVAALPSPSPVELAASFAEILHNSGWHSEASLSGLVEGWRRTFDEVRPDLLVADYSPSALLAADAAGIPRVLVSTGFTGPPDVEPLPDVLPSADPGRYAEAIAREGALLRRVNALLARHGARPLDRVAQLFARVNLHVLATWPQLDPYGSREGARYAGVWSDRLGDLPAWPRGAGPRVVAYLKSFPALPALLEVLRRSGLPVVAYVADADLGDPAFAPTNTVRILDQPLDLAGAARQADLAILNAGHGATALALLQGTPILQVPLVLEQFHVARRTCEMGAGLMAGPGSIEPIGAALQRLLAEPAFKRSAVAFRKLRQGFRPEAAVESVVDAIARAAPSPR